jgi:hypothetical protein
MAQPCITQWHSGSAYSLATIEVLAVAGALPAAVGAEPKDRETAMSKTSKRPQRATEEPAAAPRFRGVAYYRHSAEDQQKKSVAIQQDMVRKWAKDNGVEIIQEFAERGKTTKSARRR